jgi:hypothetical protein
MTKLKILIKFGLFWGFSWELRPARAFFYKTAAAEHFFVRMWPSNIIEIETPDVDHLKGTFKF